jgi:hypothetical protein
MNQSYGEDRIYYNVSIRSDDTQGQTQAYYLENRTIPLIDEPEQYYITVARFSIPGNAIPIFIMEAQLGQANVNLTPYTVTIRYLNVDYSVNVIYVPRNTFPTPAPPLVQQDVSTGYYYVYSYEHMLDMINQALATAFVTATLPAPYSQPYLQYNAETGLIDLITGTNWRNGTGNLVPTIYINHKLHKFLQGFDYSFFGYNQSNGKDYRFEVKFRTYNSYAQPGGTIPIPPLLPEFIYQRQEYNTSAYWNSLQDIVFTTNMGIEPENIQSNTTTTGAPNFRSILTDFEPVLDKQGDYAGVYQYDAQLYRVINVNDTTPLRNIDFQIWWREKGTGQLRPLYITYGQEINVKFLFISKASYDG